MLNLRVCQDIHSIPCSSASGIHAHLPDWNFRPRGPVQSYVRNSCARARDRGARTSCTHGSNRITEVTDKSAVVGVPQASSTVWTTAMGVSTLSDVLYVRTPVRRCTHARMPHA